MALPWLTPPILSTIHGIFMTCAMSPERCRHIHKYGYIRLTQFQERTKEDLNNAIKELQKSAKGDLKGILLDLRNNPGGLLDKAVGVSDEFMAGGLITYIEGRKPEQRAKFFAQKNGDHYMGPLVVLVNEGSTSASEIVAGALQDSKRAIIAGTRTFGKGSVQTIIPMPDGSALRLTTARYYTPSGRSIQADGIHPDLVIENDFARTKGTLPFLPETQSGQHPYLVLIPASPTRAKPNRTTLAGSGTARMLPKRP
jgi:C-terminal peptidase prc